MLALSRYAIRHKELDVYLGIEVSLDIKPTYSLCAYSKNVWLTDSLEEARGVANKVPEFIWGDAYSEPSHCYSSHQLEVVEFQMIPEPVRR